MAARTWKSLTRLGSVIKCNAWEGGYRLSKRCYTNKNILKLGERGIFDDIFPPLTPQVLDVIAKEPVGVYAGFDPTADSLHLGHLLVVMGMLHCQRAGHKVIALIGEATAQIGDPSDKTQERDPVQIETLKKNVKSIEKNLRRIFENHEKCFWTNKGQTDPLYPLRIVNNMNWYADYNIIDFMSTAGRYFRIGPMLQKKFVRARLEDGEGMSLPEFTYQIFQAYDWLHLYRKYNCVLQIGGNDQLGNIHTGHDLINRIENKTAYGLLAPLLTAAGGEKIAKTAGNAVWLNDDKTSAFDFYQYCIRVEDTEVEKYLKLFTFLPLDGIEAIMKKAQTTSEPRYAQHKLAQNLTLLVHGEEGLASAERATKAMFDARPESLAGLTEHELKNIFQEVSSLELILNPGTTILKLAMMARCFTSEAVALHIIKQGGFYVNHRRIIAPEDVLIPGEHILPNNMSVLRVGKRNYYLVKWLMMGQ